MQDRVAERQFYETLFREKPNNEHIVAGYDELYEVAFPESPGGVVLDVGCGTGAHALRMAQRGYRVLATDLTVEGTRQARERLKKAGLNGWFMVSDAEHLPLRDGAVATAWTSLLLHHFPQLDKLPAELARVTRNRVVAFEPNAHNLLTWLAFNVVNRVWTFPAWTKNQRALRPNRLRRIFDRVGFETTDVHYVDRGWSDGMSAARRMYHACTRWLPTKRQANKFLIGFRKRGS